MDEVHATVEGSSLEPAPEAGKVAGVVAPAEECAGPELGPAAEAGRGAAEVVGVDALAKDCAVPEGPPEEEAAVVEWSPLLGVQLGVQVDPYRYGFES